MSDWVIEFTLDSGGAAIQHQAAFDEDEARRIFGQLFEASVDSVRYQFTDKRGMTFNIDPARYFILLLPPSRIAEMQAVNRVQSARNEGGIITGGSSH